MGAVVDVSDGRAVYGVWLGFGRIDAREDDGLVGCLSDGNDDGAAQSGRGATSNGDDCHIVTTQQNLTIERARERWASRDDADDTPDEPPLAMTYAKALLSVVF